MSDRTDPSHGRLTVETDDDGHAVRIILSGEADLANLEELENALAAIALDGTQEVHLQIRDLDFVDVAALRQLTVFARHLRGAGRDVKTYGAQPTLEQLMHLAGVRDDLGLA